jgi:apolipoprotein N-acyltransferase
MKSLNPIRNKFLTKVKNNLVFILPILSGVLLILSYPPYNLEFLIWVGLLPLIYFLSLKSVSAKKALMGGVIFGIIFFGKLFSWLFATAPFEWLSIEPGKNLILIFIFLIILYLIQTIFLGLFFGIFAWTIKKVIGFSLITSWSLLTIPFLWIIFEYLRAWAFGILWLGKETLFGPHWTFGNLAYTLHNNSIFIQFADIGGIYGISFLIVLVNTILFLIINYFLKLSRDEFFKKALGPVVILILIALAWAGYGVYQTHNSYKSNETRRIALVQTNFLSGAEFSPYQKEEVFNAVLGLFRESPRENPDFIIAPEGFGIVSLVEDIEIAKYLLEDFWQPDQIFLENKKITEEDGKTKSRLFYYKSLLLFTIKCS